MPLKLIPPRPGKTPFFSVRGTHLGVYVDRSTKATERATASKLLKLWKEEIEAGAFRQKGEPTFLDAAVKYMAATGAERFMQPIVEHLGALLLRDIDQQAIDETAMKLYPAASPATRNRQVYTIISAVLKHAGHEGKIKRPKGWRGSKRTEWLKAEQAFALFAACDSRDAEFGLFIRTLTYTGMRLSECIGMTVDRVEIDDAFAYVPTTKNGEPRGVHLPPVIVTGLKAHPRGMDRPGERVFRFTKNGRLYAWLDAAFEAAGIEVAPRTGFHILRHTWATWMRRYGGLDTRGLVGTGAWADEESASRYEHVIATEEARRADLLPVEKTWKMKERKRKAL